MFTSHRCLITLLSLSFLSVTDAAAQLYRYKDEQGNYVLNQTIPPQFVSKGYEVLNNQGRVIRQVAPALTPEQIAARDAQREKERLAKIEQEKQAAKDEELKQLYSHPDDAVRVLKRQLQDIETLIQVKKGFISTTRAKILDEETRAANRQRNGLSVEESTLEKLAMLKSDIANSQHDIGELKTEYVRVKEDFLAKIQRLEIITGRKASPYSLESKLTPKSKPDEVASEAPPTDNAAEETNSSSSQ